MHPLLFLAILYFSVPSVDASEPKPKEDAFLGGSTSIGEELSQAAEVHSRSTWKWKGLRARLIEQHGLAVSSDYATLLQQADGSLSGSDQAMSGVFRLYGRWTLVGRGTDDAGTLVAKVEQRHRLSGDVTPAGLASEIGYAGITGLGFSDAGAFVAPFYWEQFFASGHVGIVAGRLDSTDFMDILGLGSQWNSFQNAAAISNLSIPEPDLGYGVGAGVKLNDQWVIGTTLHDANGKQTDARWFRDGGELFKQAYVSWTPTRARRFTNAAHLTLWHQDSRETRELEESYGVAVSGNWLFNERWMPFLRWGIADGDAPLARQQLTMGMMFNVPDSTEQLGVSAWWQDLSHRDLDDQSGLELFYRWQVIPNLAITPSVQLLNDPALNSDENSIIVYGLRARVTFF